MNHRRRLQRPSRSHTVAHERWTVVTAAGLTWSADENRVVAPVSTAIGTRPEDLRRQLASAVMELVATLGQPHRHTGLGVRKIHQQGVFEFRLGRHCRVVFTQPEKDLVMLHLLGNHADVQRFLDSL